MSYENENENERKTENVRIANVCLKTAKSNASNIKQTFLQPNIFLGIKICNNLYL